MAPIRVLPALAALVLLTAGICPGTARAQHASLFAAVLTDASPAPLIELSRRAPDGAPRGSLLQGRVAGDLFSFRPAKTARPPARRQEDARVARLRDLIALAEAGPLGYDAVQYGARIRPEKPPTRMTLAEIFAWTEATPGQPHAIGRYQVIPKTLAHLVRRLELPPEARFTPTLQDRLADALLAEAGLEQFLAGEIGRHAMMNRIARVWAGLPNSTGKSHYHGHAGNKATMTWAAFDEAMARIFPG